MHDFWTQAQPIRQRLVEQRMPSLPTTAPRDDGIVDLITRSPIAAYRFKTGWELLDDHDYYPDEYLANLARCGINGVWVAGLFRTLIASSVLPELGPERHRLDKLKALVEKAARHGIKVHLFCMEPRSVRADHPVVQAHPEIVGAKVSDNEVCLCTSTALVRDYLRSAIRDLFTEVPALGGIITIFNGERITNCWLSEEYARTCPRCSQRLQIDVLAENLKCFAEAPGLAGSPARCMAWTYCMNEDNDMETNPVEPILELIEKTDKRIVWLANFEHGGKKTIGGKEVPIDEYSLSYTGPSQPFIQVVQKAHSQHCRSAAKLQIGTAFELSCLPYLPVPGIVYDKFRAMKSLGVNGAMLNWIPGGFPSVMLQAAGLAARSSLPKQDFLRELAGLNWPDLSVDLVVDAWNCFEAAFQEYPFNNRFFYFGPIFRAPAYPLRLARNPNVAHPLNWGIDRHRKPQPFEEEIDRWLGPFTAEELIAQLDKMSDLWNEGLVHLTEAVKRHDTEPARRELAVASAAHGHFRSARNVISFLLNRRQLVSADDSQRDGFIASMKQSVSSQILAAEQFKEYISLEPAIGYQSELLAFSYDGPMLDDAIAINRRTLQLLDGPYSTLQTELKNSMPSIPIDRSIPELDLYGD